MDLAGATVELVNLEEREYILQKALQGVVTPKGKDFDYIIIDCPPSLDLLTVNALVAADFVLIPVQCEFYALEGFGTADGNDSTHQCGYESQAVRSRIAFNHV